MDSNRVVFLKGKKTILRPLRKDDAVMFQKWINDPEVRNFLSAVFPAMLQNEEEWIESHKKDKDDICFVIETLDGKPIGTMELHHINWIDRRAMTGAMIGEKDFWGKGYGQDAKMQILNYAFNTLGLRKICSDALIYNKRSIGHNLKCGYKLICVKKSHLFKNGRFYDDAYLECTKKDWLPFWKKYNTPARQK